MPHQPDLIDPFDDCEWVPARELFRRSGFQPAVSVEVDEFQLRGRLWEVIYALAGRRIYLHHTDHLSDRALYTWLVDEWFQEEIADIPPEAEWNYHMDASDFDNGLDPIIWLRYFATEEEQLAFATEHSLESIPAHEDPPYDRDRWLPKPPGMLEVSDFADDDPAYSDENPEAGTDPEQIPESEDPLGLAAADAEIEAEQRRHRVTDERENFEAVEDGPQAAASGGEIGPWKRPIDQLQQTGVNLLPPDELTDETLGAKLWELLHNLASRGFYVLHTDHLGDRELYTLLWNRGLREEALLPGKLQTSCWFHDVLGSGSEEDIQLSLRYYDSDETRADYARDWPEIPLPPKEKPPFHRDWRLPQGPF